MAALGGRLYLVGGADAFSLLPVGVDAFDVATEQWSPQRPASPPVGKVGGAAVALRGWLFALGGAYSEVQLLNPAITVFSYDPAIDTWDEQRPMRQPRVHLGAATIEHTVIALGGSPQWGTGDAVTSSVEQWATGVGSLACDPHEPDDRAGLATPWSVFHQGELARPMTQGRVCAPSDADYYAVGEFLTAVRRVTFQLTPPPGADYLLELLNARGTVVLATSARPGNATESIARLVEPGVTYLVRVRSQDGSFDRSQPYRLEVQ
jgi:hypothetical protein